MVIDPGKVIAETLAHDFADRWFALLVAGVEPPRQPGRPRLVVPEQYRSKYPYWRKMYGAKVAREMAGVA